MNAPMVARGDQPWALFVALSLLGVLYNELEAVHGIGEGEMEVDVGGVFIKGCLRFSICFVGMLSCSDPI